MFCLATHSLLTPLRFFVTGVLVWMYFPYLMAEFRIYLLCCRHFIATQKMVVIITGKTFENTCVEFFWHVPCDYVCRKGRKGGTPTISVVFQRIPKNNYYISPQKLSNFKKNIAVNLFDHSFCCKPDFVKEEEKVIKIIRQYEVATIFQAVHREERMGGGQGISCPRLGKLN